MNQAPQLNPEVRGPPNQVRPPQIFQFFTSPLGDMPKMQLLTPPDRWGGSEPRKTNKRELLWTCDKLQWTYHNSAKFKGELATKSGLMQKVRNRLMMGTEKTSSQNREIRQKSRF